MFFVFFFKQKTAYEMRISDWSSDVCSSDLKAVGARELWDKVAHAAWACADPGVQYDTTINDWHTCPAGGRINASNPCSEYMFLDDTACHLASMNLIQFQRAAGSFDIAAYEQATPQWTVTPAIAELIAQFPAKGSAHPPNATPHP